MKAVSVYRQQEKEGSVRVYRIAEQEKKTKTSSVNKPQQQEQVKERVNSGCVPMPACVANQA